MPANIATANRSQTSQSQVALVSLRTDLWNASGFGSVLELILDEICQNIARADAVTGDIAFLRHFQSHGLGETCYAMLCCVVGALVW